MRIQEASPEISSLPWPCRGTAGHFLACRTLPASRIYTKQHENKPHNMKATTNTHLNTLFLTYSITKTCTTPFFAKENKKHKNRFAHTPLLRPPEAERTPLQVVILGAGYDMRGFRLQLPEVHIFEVDQPAVQAAFGAGCRVEHRFFVVFWGGEKGKDFEKTSVFLNTTSC